MRHAELLESLLVRADAVELLLEATRHHKDSETVQRACLTALRNLVCSGMLSLSPHPPFWVNAGIICYSLVGECWYDLLLEKCRRSTHFLCVAVEKQGVSPHTRHGAALWHSVNSQHQNVCSDLREDFWLTLLLPLLPLC